MNITVTMLGIITFVLVVVLVVVYFIVKRKFTTATQVYQTRDMYINSLYICVYDMDRAIDFYESFFEQQVTVRDEIYSVFELYGFRFGLFAFEKKHEVHSFGSNCIPSIAMESLDMLQEKLSMLNVVFPLTQINDNWVAEFEDSEGNHIEVTAPVF